MAAVDPPLGGVAFLRVNGQQYQLRGNLKVGPVTEDASYVAGQDGVHGYITKPAIPYIEAELSDSAGLSVLDLVGMRGGTVTAELANGKVYVLTAAIFSGATAIETADAKISGKWEGRTCKEILS